MCGCFKVDADNRQVREYIDMLPADSPSVKVGDVFPGEHALALCAQNEDITPRAMLWGFPRWKGKRLIFNARAETALEKSMFAKALRQRRMAAPANCFYEWRQEPGKKGKDKFSFTAGEILYLAGMWSFFAETEGGGECFTLLTTQANASMLPYHHRMPVLLRRDELSAWINGRDFEKLLFREPFPTQAREIPRL